MNRIVVITGSASGIGKAAKQVFTEMGDTVLGIDILPGEYFLGDISFPEVLEAFASKIIEEYGHVDVLINNALPLKKGISSCTYQEFMYALQVGVAAPFYLSKLLKDYFTPGGCIINVSSTRDSQSQAESESYSAAKGGIRALTHAMAVSLGPAIRVNSISPGWIDTHSSVMEAADLLQQPAGKVGLPEEAAWLMAFLASDIASFIDGEDIKIDGGMSKRMIYHGDENWTYQPDQNQIDQLIRLQQMQMNAYAPASPASENTLSSAQQMFDTEQTMDAEQLLDTAVDADQVFESPDISGEKQANSNLQSLSDQPASPELFNSNSKTAAEAAHSLDQTKEEDQAVTILAETLLEKSRIVHAKANQSPFAEQVCHKTSSNENRIESMRLKESQSKTEPENLSELESAAKSENLENNISAALSAQQERAEEAGSFIGSEEQKPDLTEQPAVLAKQPVFDNEDPSSHSTVQEKLEQSDEHSDQPANSLQSVSEQEPFSDPGSPVSSQAQDEKSGSDYQPSGQSVSLSAGQIHIGQVDAETLMVFDTGDPK